MAKRNAQVNQDHDNALQEYLLYDSTYLAMRFPAISHDLYANCGDQKRDTPNSAAHAPSASRPQLLESLIWNAVRILELHRSARLVHHLCF